MSTPARVEHASMAPMSRTFSFERDTYATLEFIPLALRRKLDLAGIKLSLSGFRALPLDDRRSLLGAVDPGVPGEPAFEEVLRAAAARAGVALEAISIGEPAWRSEKLPEVVRERASALGLSLPESAWQKLTDEDRHAVLKLAEAKRDTERLGIALAEIGIS